MNDFDSYQYWTRATAIYPTDDERVRFGYTALGLAGEAGEVANKVKKLIRDDTIKDRDAQAAVAMELGDVLWYLARLADDLGFDLTEIVLANQAKLNGRKDRGTIGGSGDTR